MDAEHPSASLLPERLYHSCHNNPATMRDFWSWERIKGKEHPDPKQRENAQGISAWRTLERARAEAASSGAQGPWIAEIELSHVRGIRYKQTGKADHYTLWADPQAFVDAIAAMHPVQE
jgi:hypothetical protein